MGIAPSKLEIIKAWEANYRDASYNDPKATISKPWCYPMLSKGVVAWTAEVDIVAT